MLIGRGTEVLDDVGVVRNAVSATVLLGLVFCQINRCDPSSLLWQKLSVSILTSLIPWYSPTMYLSQTKSLGIISTEMSKEESGAIS